MFLLFAVAIYIGDIGLDIFVAYEHHKHYSEGDQDSKWYFILTVVFIILPSLVMNFVSWGLYTWCYIVNSWPSCRRYLQKRSQRKFGSALMYVNYSRAYSPNEVVTPRQKKKAHHEMPQNVFGPLNSLESGLIRIANRTFEGDGYSSGSQNGVATERSDQSQSQSPSNDDSHTEQEDEVDTNIKFKAVDDFNFMYFLIITILHVFQFGLLVRVLRLIYQSSKNKYSFYRYYDLTFLRLIESFMESAPQLILQLYIYVVNPETDPVYRIVTPISMLFSLASLALAITDYLSAGKDILYYMFNKDNAKHRLSWKAYFVIIFWQLCLIVSRTLAFAFFAIQFGLYLFVFLLGHFLFMVFWIYFISIRSESYKMCEWLPISEDQTDSRKMKYCWINPIIFLTRNCCLELVVAAFNSFFFFHFTVEKFKLTWVLYYTLQAIENATLICLFFAFTDSPLKWYNITSLISTFFFFLCGMAFMGLYYAYLHPARTSQDQTDLATTEFERNFNVASEFFYDRIHLTFTLHWLLLQQ